MRILILSTLLLYICFATYIGYIGFTNMLASVMPFYQEVRHSCERTSPGNDHYQDVLYRFNESNGQGGVECGA